VELQTHGYTHLKHVNIKEQLSIFLYSCVTDLSITHIGECFQQSNDMISRHYSALILLYFKRVLNAFSHPDIYNKCVCLPHVSDSTPPEILHDPRFYPAF
ncbi:hypothetical protein PAXRUDRAFT_772594, partial [Paxillus rubicundulus Ve08.2h10]